MLAHHTGQTIEKVKNDTDRDFIMSAEEARVYGIVDEVNLKHRSYPAARGRQAILLNRDIIKLFGGLRVSDSFLLKNTLREILFRKPA